MSDRLRCICLGLMLAAAGSAARAAESVPPAADTIVVTADLQAKIVDAGLLGTVDILTTPYSVNSIPPTRSNCARPAR